MSSKSRFKHLAAQLVALEAADTELRAQLALEGNLGNGYNEKMKILHNQNAEALEKIIADIGYPTTQKVGERASKAAWIVIQHSIAKPDFMRSCCGLLQQAVDAGTANPKDFAYLFDRIAVFEGKPQRYGTQFDWDSEGKLSPNTFDSLNAVDKRRRNLGLNTLEEQTSALRQRATFEKQKAPEDYIKYKQQLDNWRKSVGWT